VPESRAFYKSRGVIQRLFNRAMVQRGNDLV